MSVAADLVSGSLDSISRCRVEPKPHFDPCAGLVERSIESLVLQTKHDVHMLEASQSFTQPDSGFKQDNE